MSELLGAVGRLLGVSWRGPLGVGISVATVSIAADAVELLLSGANNSAEFPLGGRGATIVASWVRTVAVGASCILGAVGPSRSVVVVYPLGAVAAAGHPGALQGVAVALASRIVSGDGRFFIDESGDFADVKEPEGADWR